MVTVPPTPLQLEKLSSPAPKAVVNAKPKRSRRKAPKIFLGVLLLLAVALGLLALVTIPAVFSIKNTGTSLAVSLKDLRDSLSTRNLVTVSQKLDEARAKTADFSRELGRLGWISPLPVAGQYIKDANSVSTAGLLSLEAAQLVVKTIEPYADILGLTGVKTATDGAKTAQDRITFIVETVSKITPQLDEIGTKLHQASQTVSGINPSRYPAEFQGFPVRDSLVQLQDILKQVSTVTYDAKPLLESAPYILGIDKKRTYLVIFQNDAELRPTGGFMTAYALLEVSKGKVKPLFSDDIYTLDAKYNPTLKAHPALIKYIAFPYQKDPRWRIRDMNMSPDFKVSMETFLPEYLKTGSPRVDGIIAVDTQVLLELLKVIGKIGVPGQGNFSADNDPRCNCPVVIYELESLISVETPFIRPERKAILGPLMNSILANAVGQPKEKIALLSQVVLKSIQEKHVLFYFTDPEIQKASESFNLGGRVKEWGGDYLMLVGTNLAGAKSNLYVQTEVEDEITTNSDGTVNHELTVSFTNPQKYDGWLNGENRNWFRVYVPQGSVLKDSTGSETKIETSEDLGKTVFAGFITVRPGGGVARFTLNYTTPALIQNNIYSLLIQKQAGTKKDPYILTINGKDQEFDLAKDHEIKLTVK